MTKVSCSLKAVIMPEWWLNNLFCFGLSLFLFYINSHLVVSYLYSSIVIKLMCRHLKSSCIVIFIIKWLPFFYFTSIILMIWIVKLTVLLKVAFIREQIYEPRFLISLLANWMKYWEIATHWILIPAFIYCNASQIFFKRIIYSPNSETLSHSNMFSLTFAESLGLNVVYSRILTLTFYKNHILEDVFILGKNVWSKTGHMFPSLRQQGQMSKVQIKCCACMTFNR